jgi:hypothetical protein
MPHNLPFPTSNLYSHFRPKHVLYQIMVNVRLQLHSGHSIPTILGVPDTWLDDGQWCG